MGVQQVLCTENNLVLLASSEHCSVTLDDELHLSNWTIYNLQQPDGPALYRDFMELAKNHRHVHRATYLHFLCDAHMVVRIAREFLTEAELSRKESTTNFGVQNKIEENARSSLDKMFVESCLNFGDVYVT